MYVACYLVEEPNQYLNLIQILQIKGDYENAAYELIKKGEKEIAYTLAL